MQLTKTFLLFYLTFLFVQFQAVAQDNSARILQETERLQQQSEQQERLERIQKAFDEGKEEAQKEQAIRKTRGPCFTVNAFDIEGATVLSDSAKDDIFGEYVGTCVSVGTLDVFIRKLTQWYVEHGYVTARIYIPKQNLKSGTLKLRVVEGKVEKIILNDDSYGDKVRAWTAIPVNVGDTLILKEVERGVEQLKHPQSSEATMTIEPGTKPGRSILRFRTQDQRPYRLGIGYDNLGQESTGEHRFRLTAGVDNVLSLNETWSALILSNTDFWDKDRGSQVYMLSYTMPLRMWRMTTSLTHTEYKTSSTGLWGLPLETSGDSNKVKLDLERRLMKTHKTQLDFTTGFTYYDTNAYLFDVLNPASTYDLTTLLAGLKLDFAWGKSYFMTHLKYTRGIYAFGSKKDHDEIGVDVPHAQFDKYTLSVMGTRSWQTGKQSALNLTSNAFFQYAPETLYSSENIIIGDRYSVRGFKKDSGYGRSGFYVQNDLSLDLMHNVGDSWWTQPFKRLQPFIGFDAGQVEYYDGTDELMGWAVGIKSVHSRFNAEIVYSGPLKSPDHFEDEHVLYLGVNVTIF